MAEYYGNNDYRDYLAHHGILKQKWGVRHGPPYPLKGGDYSKLEREAIIGQRKHGNALYKKRHFDETLRAGKDSLTTLSYDKDRTKNTDMFYAAHTFADRHQYNALFNRPIQKPILDKDGNEIGSAQCMKYRINHKLNKDVKVASEDSSADIFMNLYKNDRDFYNFVTDEGRMRSYFVEDKYKFRGYRESRDVLDKLKDPSYKPTSGELQVAYRMFNYVIPYDGGGTNARGAKDVKTQRAKFFNAAKKAGYGAVLDTNDAIYGAFKATSPVIVFDMESLISPDIKQTKMSSKAVSSLVLAGRRALHV